MERVGLNTIIRACCARGGGALSFGRGACVVELADGLDAILLEPGGRAKLDAWLWAALEHVRTYLDEATGMIGVASRAVVDPASVDVLVRHGALSRPYLCVEIAGDGVRGAALTSLQGSLWRRLGASREAPLLEGITRGVACVVDVGCASETCVRVRLYVPLPHLRAPSVVLVIDDEPSMLRGAQRVLHHLGFSALTASDGFVGERVYRQHQDAISIIILDMMMPGRDGAATLRALRAHGLSQPVVVSSGYDEVAVRELMVGLEPLVFFPKPWRLRALESLLHDMLAS